jgi:type III restriction enzyme
VLHSAEFKALWDRIKHKTTYRVQFDNEADRRLHQGAADAPPIAERPACSGARPTSPSARRVVEATETEGRRTVVLDEGDIELPDCSPTCRTKTQLTRRSIHRILVRQRRLDDFKRNPQQFIELAAEPSTAQALALVDGIKYQRLGDEHYYAQELFEQEELTGYLKNMR